ncbi:hypothetical protein GTA08_BOTSDO00862 [Neofusicoccum parvum]|uniref:Uncharacterized protein n=1 Tax=Neofusicoccum parvum TaxID=310453 RepID=A0ACB5S9C8_9PEZI|nr:hypothetical protein GTA08_BOTSDO00862 [Neofusicoccum parvum]
MFRLLASALREEQPPAQQQEPAEPPSPLAAARPGSPRLQVEHARRLEEELAIARADLADQRGAYEARLADQKEKLTAKLDSQRDVYESKTRRLEVRNAWLEDTVGQLTDEKRWLANRNEALEAAEKRLDARVGELEEQVFELKAEGWALRQENADYKVDFDGVIGEVARLQRAAEKMAERARRALTMPKAKEARSPDAGAGADAEGEQVTPRGKRIEGPDGSLSGETLGTGPRSRERGRPEVNSQAGCVDPRSVEALRTLGASRNASPTPERGQQRRLGGGGVCAGGGAAAGSSSAENVTVRPSRKRQRTESDPDSGMAA